MKITRFDWDGEDPRGLAAEIRALQPALGEVSESVAEIIAAVDAGGDAAVMRFEGRFGEWTGGPRFPPPTCRGGEIGGLAGGPRDPLRPGDGREQHPLGRRGAALR